MNPEHQAFYEEKAKLLRECHQLINQISYGGYSMSLLTKVRDFLILCTKYKSGRKR